MSDPADGVALLHALARRPASMAALSESLHAAGFLTISPAYPSRRATIAQCARGLAAEVGEFAERVGRLHFVGHSMGGLVARAYIAEFRPRRLGRVVTMGTPHRGSELADLLAPIAVFRAFYGPALGELTTATRGGSAAVDFPLGSLAGRRALNVLAARFVLPRPNDGAVSVAATRVAGMADHVIVDCDHFRLPRHAGAIEQCLAFLTAGRFTPP